MTTTLEPKLSGDLYGRVNQLSISLLGIAQRRTTRLEVARTIREHGLVPYIGGHHVAIHAPYPDASQKTLGERLAVVTHEGEDWR